ncbi:hypothetical protein [Ferroacidibacillus organovorans]|nr:hypothetical protein [Ferroacidibacillus organovorans]
MFDETVSGGGGAGPGGIGGAINRGDQIAKSVDENLVGTTSGIAQNEIVPVSLQVDQLLNDISRTGLINQGTVDVNSLMRK